MKKHNSYLKGTIKIQPKLSKVLYISVENKKIKGKTQTNWKRLISKAIIEPAIKEY